MTWYTKTNDACASTEAMMNELYDWLTGATAGFPTGVTAEFPSGPLFTAGIKDATPANSLTIPGSLASGRWASPNSTTISAARQRLWRMERGGVAYWFMLDAAYVGGSPSLPNLGLYCWLSTTLGTTADNFAALAVAAAVTGSPTSPYASACYPAHGATAYHFFTDGRVIHVVFKRSHTTTSSWQHFSFGKIQKPTGATWVGGEYFHGCDGPETTTAASWDYTDSSVSGALTIDHPPLLSCGSSSYGSGTNYGSATSLFRRGFIRVVGAKAATTPYTAASYCALGTNIAAAAPTMSQNQGATHILGGASKPLTGAGVGATRNRSIFSAAANTWNQRSAGAGVEIFYYDGANDAAATGPSCLYLGSIPGIRFISIENIADEGVVNQDWRAFPLSNRTTYNNVIGENGHTKTGSLGVAYKMP